MITYVIFLRGKHTVGAALFILIRIKHNINYDDFIAFR